MNKIIYLFSIVLSGLLVTVVTSCSKDDNNQSKKWDVGETPGTVFATLDNGILTISGSGEIINYYDGWHERPPWASVSNSITGFVIKGDITDFPREFMQSNPHLTTVSLEGSMIEIIDSQSFSDCENLTSITLPDCLKSIGWSIFANCKSLTSITITDGVTRIEANAFQDCESLSSITIPNSVTYIGPRAFVRCGGLTSVIIGNEVTTIEREAFEDCENITSIVIPSSVKFIGQNAFSGCSSLSSLTIPNVEWIHNRAFENCSSLTTVTILDSLQTIGQYAFNGCSSLTSVTIPASVTEIQYWAFQDCESLSSFTVHWPTPLPVTHLAFLNVNTSDVTLYVPAGTEELYKSAPIWRDFNIVAL